MNNETITMLPHHLGNIVAHDLSHIAGLLSGNGLNDMLMAIGYGSSVRHKMAPGYGKKVNKNYYAMLKKICAWPDQRILFIRSLDEICRECPLKRAECFREGEGDVAAREEYCIEYKEYTALQVIDLTRKSYERRGLPFPSQEDMEKVGGLPWRLSEVFGYVLKRAGRDCFS